MLNKRVISNKYFNTFKIYNKINNKQELNNKLKNQFNDVTSSLVLMSGFAGSVIVFVKGMEKPNNKIIYSTTGLLLGFPIGIVSGITLVMTAPITIFCGSFYLFVKIIHN
jgi:hypothetical protein